MSLSMNNTYWFKRRRYGYGWTPVTWQGWAAVGGFLAITLVGALLSIMFENTANQLAFAITYLITMLLATFLLIAVSIKKSPAPKWRWGSKPEDDPALDA